MCDYDICIKFHIPSRNGSLVISTKLTAIFGFSISLCTCIIISSLYWQVQGVVLNLSVQTKNG